ncbi:kinesin-like protein KIF17, partial [Sapajus apella]|uniref:Kinesin-like protein KIF17 n=1 Tax=Sapajus apella TaxID=9515 RepID=A0A6J3HG45_SAPAP
MEAEKQLIREEYEERLARLKADYKAEQESRARLEEDITAMRNSYDVRLSTLQENLRKETGGSSLSPGAVSREGGLFPPHCSNYVTEHSPHPRLGSVSSSQGSSK